MPHLRFCWVVDYVGRISQLCLNEEKTCARPNQGAKENILFRDGHAHILLVGMHRERENSHVMRIPDCWSGCAVAVKRSSEG